MKKSQNDIDFKEVFLKLDAWIEANPTSYDLLDIKNQWLFIGLIKLSRKSKFFKIITAPPLILAERIPGCLRFIFGVKKKKYVQASAIIARSYFLYFKKTGQNKYLEKGLENLKWIESNRSKEHNEFCWGQPYDWFSRKVIPKGTPRATVTTQVAEAFLDAYEITKEKHFLEVADSACRFFLDELQMNEEDRTCFSYTNLDRYHIHNANMLVVAALIRTWGFNNKESYKRIALKAMKFTLDLQNPDGSWFYWAPPDKVLGRIDNYHTGFVLESLCTVKECLGEEWSYEDNLKKGMQYYIDNLFEEGYIPKMTNIAKYPIDIQSCAQSILTFSRFSEDAKLLEKANEIAEWTIHNFQSNPGYFYYRHYKSGRIDKTPYLRWSEAWMLRALANII